MEFPLAGRTASGRPGSAATRFDLSGRVVVVTGGNGGIGLGLARGVAKAGADVAIWARDAAKSEAAKAELEGHGVRVATLTCDVADPDAIVRATAETVEQLGRIDVGFANAGFGAMTNSL